MSGYIKDVLESLEKRNPGEKEFLAAAKEALSSIALIIDDHPDHRKSAILERLVEPERTITFRAPWVDDDGKPHVSRGWRVQFSSALGPYKGGLRFHPSVTQSVLKFLGFEQTFKNSLTGLSLGGAKGGADFDPKGRSDDEIRRFCESFMDELHRHIGPDRDVPAGDIGVGSREIGYLFGRYRRLRSEFTGTLTGKGLAWGGSPLRTEATGYGVVYFAAEMLKDSGKSLEGKRCIVSGSGNVAVYTAEKLIDMGARPITLSDSGGFIYEPDGLTREKLDWIKELKFERRGRISEYADEFSSAKYTKAPKEGANPLWQVEADGAFPCATQNELDDRGARDLVKAGVKLVVEGANMPATHEAVEVFREKQIAFAPGKASNAGGVAVSGLEMSQNSMRLTWTEEEVEGRLRAIIERVHKSCLDMADVCGKCNDYAHGANIAGYLRVAAAMKAQGAW